MANAYMAKQEATRIFRERYAAIIKAKKDKPAIRQAWNDFKDELHRDGSISYVQACNWVNPVLEPKDR